MLYFIHVFFIMYLFIYLLLFFGVGGGGGVIIRILWYVVYSVYVVQTVLHSDRCQDELCVLI